MAKKQGQRLIPEYLLNYTTKLEEAHPNPEASWGGGGGGGDYTAGEGIDITNDVISVDDTVVALKTDIPDVSNYVTSTQLSSTLTDYAKLDDDTQNITANTVTVTHGAGYIHTTYGPTTISMGIPRTPGYTLSIPTKDGTLATLEDIPSLSGYATENWVLSQSYVTSAALTNYVTTTQLEDALDDYALKTDLPENVSDLNNDAGYITNNALTGYATESWVSSQGYLSSATLDNYVTSTQLGSTLSNYAQISTLAQVATTGSYNDLINTPDLTVYALSSELSNYATVTSLNSLSSSVTDLATIVSGHTTDIGNLQTSVSNCITVSQLSDTLSNYTTKTELSSQLSSYATLAELSGYATTTSLNNLSSTVTDLASIVSGHTSSIGSLNSQVNQWSTYCPFLNVETEDPVGMGQVMFTTDGTNYYKYVQIPSGSTLSVNLNWNYTLGLINSKVDSTVLSNYATLSTLSSYVTSSGLSTALSEYPKTTTLASVATTGNYNDLTNKPTIPSIVANPATTTQTLSALQIDGVGYSIAGGGASYSLSTTSQQFIYYLSDNTSVTYTFITGVSLISS